MVDQAAPDDFLISLQSVARSPTQNRRIKILLLAANPTDSMRLGIDKEFRAIDRALREAEHRDDFEVESHLAVRFDDLAGLLMRHKPDIVHFSGHGSDANELDFVQNETGSTSEQLFQRRILEGRWKTLMSDNSEFGVTSALPLKGVYLESSSGQKRTKSSSFA